MSSATCTRIVTGAALKKKRPRRSTFGASFGNCSGGSVHAAPSTRSNNAMGIYSNSYTAPDTSSSGRASSSAKTICSSAHSQPFMRPSLTQSLLFRSRRIPRYSAKIPGVRLQKVRSGLSRTLVRSCSVNKCSSSSLATSKAFTT